MYNTIYFAECRDITNSKIRVDIEKKDSVSTPTELVLARSCIQIDYNSNRGLFTALKQSGCSINILTSNVLKELYTGKVDEIRVKITKDDKLFWYGFLTPNIYNSEYNNEHDLLTIECIDCLSQLSNTKFKSEEDEKLHSFYYLINKMIDTVDSEKYVNKIYFQKGFTLEGKEDLLNNILIHDRNFFDEEEEPETNKEVLEDILNYLGVSMVQFKDAFYLINYDSLKRNNYQYDYILYNRLDNTKSESSFKDIRNITEIGIADSNGNIQLGDIYNKITVIANNNPLRNVLPTLFDDEDIVNQNVDPNKYWETEREFTEKDANNKDTKVKYTFINSYFKSKKNWFINLPQDYNGNIVEVTPNNINSIRGSYIQKAASYKSDDVPSNLDFNDYFTMSVDYPLYTTYQKELQLLKRHFLAVQGGYFIINLKYQLSTDNNPSTFIKQPDIRYRDDKFTDRIVKPTLFKAILKIGRYYWNGEKWDSISNYELKESRGYYHNIDEFYSGNVEGSKWYKIINNYGYREYVTKDEYNSYQGEKYSGDCITNDMRWFKKNGQDVFCENSYYDDCYLRDGFYLAHTNKVGESCFGVDCNIDNTVSWKMNLAEPNDGAAIKLPEDTLLIGDVKFELWTCNTLGKYPSYATDQENHRCTNVHISELTLIHTTSTTVENIFTKEEFDPDILFTNVIDEGYVKEFDDLNLRVNTYSPKAGSYSYVLQELNNDYKFINNLKNIYTNEEKKMEEHIITKLVNHYNSPKFIYSNTINNKDITPISVVHSNSLNKDLVMDSFIYDIANNSVTITAIEI